MMLKQAPLDIKSRRIAFVARELIKELERELGALLKDEPHETDKISQMKIILNSCEMGDLRRALEGKKLHFLNEPPEGFTP